MVEFLKIGFSGFQEYFMTKVQIRSKGTITFPANLRKKYRMEEGEVFRLIDVGDGSFFLVPMESKVMKSADKVAKKINDANVSLEELLETLDEERHNYYKENYVKD
jgi:bifunctional DNA-binding transcriptional regulator/antitoxin component of YhaV-PrlF toxin-antitoxin module